MCGKVFLRAYSMAQCSAMMLFLENVSLGLCKGIHNAMPMALYKLYNRKTASIHLDLVVFNLDLTRLRSGQNLSGGAQLLSSTTRHSFIIFRWNGHFKSDMHWRGYGAEAWLSEAPSSFTSSFARYACHLGVVHNYRHLWKRTQRTLGGRGSGTTVRFSPENQHLFLITDNVL